MPDDPTVEAARASVESTLAEGQSLTQGDMSVAKAPLRDAHAILVEEEARAGRRSGRRPLFRGINISGVQ